MILINSMSDYHQGAIRSLDTCNQFWKPNRIEFKAPFSNNFRPPSRTSSQFPEATGAIGSGN